MRLDLVRLSDETLTARGIVRTAAEAGMEVSRVSFDLGKADEALVQARTDVHLFRVSAVSKTVADGLAIARTARAGGVKALQERDFRRKGLFVSLAIIVLAIGALILKIREVDRSRSR